MPNKTIYYIDENVLGFFLGLDDDTEKSDALREYLAKLNVLVIQTIKGYFEETIEDRLLSASATADMVKGIFGESAEENYGKVTPDDIRMNAIMPKDLKNEILSLTQMLNKFVYETYSKDLTAEKKGMLNEYLVKVESRLKTDVENTKDLLRTTAEIAQMEKDIEKLDDEIAELEGVPSKASTNSSSGPTVNLSSISGAN